jgi:hypothetical protein
MSALLAPPAQITSLRRETATVPRICLRWPSRRLRTVAKTSSASTTNPSLIRSARKGRASQPGPVPSSWGGGRPANCARNSPWVRATTGLTALLESGQGQPASGGRPTQRRDRRFPLTGSDQLVVGRVVHQPTVAIPAWYRWPGTAARKSRPVSIDNGHRSEMGPGSV